MRLGRLKITAERWPWQGYGWGLSTLTKAPLNPFGARFGGGWKYKFGIDIGTRTLVLNLIFGLVCVHLSSKEEKTNV